VRRIDLKQMKHEMMFVETEEDFLANVSAWGYGDLHAGFAQNKRFASYQAQQIEYVLELNDATPMRSPPPGAVYYPWRVYYGRSYDVVFVGEAASFHAGVKADLWNVASVDIQAYAKQRNIEARMRGRGLKASNQRAIFARTPAEVEQAYEPTSQPVPIFVEYRQLPGTAGLKNPVQWYPAPRAPSQYLMTVTISRSGWASADYRGIVRLGNAVLSQENGPDNSNRWSWSIQRRFSTNELAQGLTLEVIDRDLVNNDFMGRCLVQRNPDQLAKWSGMAPAAEAFPCGSVTVELVLKPVQ